MSYEKFKTEYVNINTFWSCNPATKRIGKLSAKAMRQGHILTSISRMSSQAFSKFESEKEQCYRSLRSLFLPHHLDKYWDVNRRYKPYYQKYSEEEKRLFNRCFNKG